MFYILGLRIEFIFKNSNVLLRIQSNIIVIITFIQDLC
jgi:hypothetical protein